VSVRELWPGIDLLDEIGPKGTSVVPTQDPRRDQVSHSHADPQELRRLGDGSSRADH
jgi:hypothetical protein